MRKKRSKFKRAQEEAEKTVSIINAYINELGEHTEELYNSLRDIQNLFDKIRNVPSDKMLEYQKLKEISLNWKKQVDKIESDYKRAAGKNASKGAAGVSLGVAVTAFGPTAAMGIATTFGVASTGTPISSLSGAAATNAALAWLGGGALAAGGGGMAAGEAFLALAGPAGWAIMGIALLGSGLLFWKSKKDKDCLEDIFTLIAERDTKSYKSAIVELKERIDRVKDETVKLQAAIKKVKTFGTNYEVMPEEQQFELGSYVNLMSASTQLLTEPILGLQPKYSEKDYFKFINDKKRIDKNKDIIISLANLLYKIKLVQNDKKLLWRSFRKNKKLLKSMNIKKRDFDFSIIETVCEALKYKYQSQ